MPKNLEKTIYANLNKSNSDEMIYSLNRMKIFKNLIQKCLFRPYIYKNYQKIFCFYKKIISKTLFDLFDYNPNTKLSLITK